MITCAMCDDEMPFAEQLRSLVMAYAKKKRVELQAETFASAEALKYCFLILRCEKWME